MSIIIPGFPAQISAIVQDRTLERVFHDSAYPNLLWRGEASRDKWVANIGERQIFTRAGLIEADVDPITPGQDPSVGGYELEQWECEAAQFGKTIPSHLPTSVVTMAPTVLRDTQQLGLHAGLTMNRLPRNRMFAAYAGGDTTVKTTGVIGSTVLHVSSLSGFTQQIIGGRLMPVSPTNPLAITFTTGPTEPANTVVGFAADDPLRPFGAGVLLLGAGLTTAVAQRVGVRAGTRTPIYRVGGGATVDGITSTNIPTVQDIINGVAILRGRRMPPHSDGTYHVHLGPTAEAALFGDNALQRIFQSLPDSTPYKDLVIDRRFGCTFFRNTEMPNSTTVRSNLVVSNGGGAGGATLAQECGVEITNAAGLPINRTLITAGGVLVEKYIDESQYISEAGVTGKVGQFSIVNGGVAVMLDGIRFIMAAPLDALQQTIRQSWSWSGDYAVPSDALAGDDARYKRALVLEHA